MTTSVQPQLNTKKTMTAAQIAFYTGKRVNRDIWQIPEGYGICTITHKMLPEAELMVTFAHTHFTDEQLAQLGHWGEGWCECAEWLSEEGYERIMARVEACGLKEVYEAGYWGPVAPAEPVQTVEAAPVIEETPAPKTVREPLPRVRAARKAEAAEIVARTKRYLESNEPAAPVVDTALADEFPNVAIDVIEESAPAETPAASEYAEGQTVRFHYWLSNVDTSVYTGVINGFKDSVFFGKTALIDPVGNAYHLTPRYVPLSRIVGVIAKEADATERIVTRAEVDRLEKAWFAAQDAPRDFDEAMSEPFYSRTHNARTAYLIALSLYRNDPSQMPCAEDIEMYEASQKPSASNEKGGSSTSTDIQVTSIDSTPEWPEMPFSPVLETSQTPCVFRPYKPIEQDAQILAATRQAQHEAAQARVEAANGKYQAPQRKEIAMQDSAYLNQIFKAAN